MIGEVFMQILIPFLLVKLIDDGINLSGGQKQRLSTVRNSKAIMVLDHGRIIEHGDHNELINQKGVYYKLYTGAFELE